MLGERRIGETVSLAISCRTHRSPGVFCRNGLKRLSERIKAAVGFLSLESCRLRHPGLPVVLKELGWYCGRQRGWTTESFDQRVEVFLDILFDAKEFKAGSLSAPNDSDSG